MSLPVKTGLPDDLDLGGDWTVRFTAVDATTGATVTAVKVSSVSITIADTGNTGLDLATYKPVLLKVNVSAP